MKKYLGIILLSYAVASMAAVSLVPSIYLKTSGARHITPFKIKGRLYLAIAQLSKDIPNTAPNMNGGNSNLPVLVYKEQRGGFKLYQRIPSHGSESAAFFRIGKRAFLAVASIRSGYQAPYDMHTDSALYEWKDNRFTRIQRFPGFATKGVSAFKMAGNQYLAFANGVVPPGTKNIKTTPSVLYQWQGEKFVPFQTFESLWAYDFSFFTFHHQHYLGLTDHLKESTLYRWNGKRFIPFQQFPQKGGRVLKYYKIGDAHYLAFATIDSHSTLYKWDNQRFKHYQNLKGKGGRNFLFFREKGNTYLLRINFILGTRKQPKTALKSPLYLWQNNQFVPIQEIDAYGGVSASLFTNKNKRYVAVANSLSKSVRFSVDSVIYELIK